jgi:tetratricopeptide (TPR) repeat protein
LSDLLTIVLGDEAVFVKDEQEIMKTVEALSARDEIRVIRLPDGDKLVSLQPSPDRVIKELRHSVIEITRIEVKLYDYFSRAEHISERHSASEIAPLLFRLAKKIDTANLNLRLQDIIRLSLQMGSQTIAEEFIDCAISSDSTSESLYDYLAKLAFLVSVKKYKQVLDLTEALSNSEWFENRTVKILKGIALNRCRKHSESEALLANLCETSDSLEELVILASYRIVGKVHANDIAGAKELFEFYNGSLSAASNYGYFLRNGAEVYEPDQGIEILSVALQYHEKSNDTFGIATTLCNRGAKLAQLGFAEKGLADVEKAYDILEVFGVNHLGIVIGDLAHCFLYMRMYEQAESTCRKALRYMGNELPRAYTLINLAAAQMLQGKSDAAIKTIEDVTKESEHARVDRVRQKAYFNGALITLLAGARHEYVQSLCVQSLNCPDRRDPNKTVERIGEIQNILANKQPKTAETFFNLYSPCSMFYWYQNPLEGLPGDFLSA